MDEKLKNRFITIACALVFSLILVWPPFDDPILVIRTVERKIGVEGNRRDQVLKWRTGEPLADPFDILDEDDKHVVEIKRGSWFRYFIWSRFDATPPERGYRNVREEILETPDGQKVKVKHVVYDQIVRVRHTLNLGLDLSGGTELVYLIKKHKEERGPEEQAPRPRAGSGVPTTVEKIVDIIKRRVDISGLKEPRIQAQGSNRILVQIPGQDKQSVADIKRIIQTAGNLQFRLAVDNPRILEDYKDLPPEGNDKYRWYTMERSDGKTERLLIEIDDVYNVTGADLKDAFPGQDQNGLPAVHFRFKRGRGKKFGLLTGQNIGRRLAIVLDDKLFSAPVIRARIEEQGIIEGMKSYKAAKELSTILSAGSLPADLILEMENTVSPFIGHDSISRGIEAIVISGVLVFAFMGAYFLLAGAIADFALLFNLLIILAVLAAFRATLTLPGIAGILLTVGIAVDANVLVYERIREERARRNTFFQALEAGYDRAFLTIFDANATSLITAAILIYIGTGPIRGFGITFAIGIAASLFTAIYVTRTIFHWLLAKNLISELRMLDIPFVRNAKYDFMRWGKTAMLGSLIVLVLGVGFFLGRWGDNFDVDFRGGYLIHVMLREHKSTAEVRKLVAEAGLGKAEVQQFGGSEEGGSTEFIIRTGKDYGYEFLSRPEKQEDGRFKVELTFHSELRPELVRTRLSGDPFSDVAVEMDGKKATILLRSPDDDVDKLRQNIRRVLPDLPKYELLQNPKFASALLPPPFKRSENGLEVSLIEPLTADQLHDVLEQHGHAQLEIKGVGTPDSMNRYSTFRIKTEPEKFGDIERLLEDDRSIKLAEPFPRFTKIGKIVAGDLMWKAILALALSWMAILIYVGLRFHGFRYGFAAIIALIHDALFTIAMLAVCDSLGLIDGKINLTMVAAILTIIGYSVNDTIVVFDRVRENLMAENRSERLDALVNRSVNEMLTRTLLTSGTTLLALLSLFIWGGGVINSFAFAMIVGVVVGTYSSTFIACPIVVHWDSVFKPSQQA